MDLDHLDGASVYFLVIMFTLFVTACWYWLLKERNKK